MILVDPNLSSAFFPLRGVSVKLGVGVGVGFYFFFKNSVLGLGLGLTLTPCCEESKNMIAIPKRNSQNC